jgi:hypothetical protein
MNNLDERLAAWNPVRAEDMHQASSSADATRLLHRILSQSSAKPPRRRALQSSWKFKAWIAGAAATAVATAAAIATVASPVPSTQHEPAAVLFPRGPSLGVATSAVELVDYATRSAALAPAFLPAPQDWAYFDVFYGLSRVGGPRRQGRRRPGSRSAPPPMPNRGITAGSLTASPAGRMSSSKAGRPPPGARGTRTWHRCPLSRPRCGRSSWPITTMIRPPPSRPSRASSGTSAVGPVPGRAVRGDDQPARRRLHRACPPGQRHGRRLHRDLELRIRQPGRPGSQMIASRRGSEVPTILAKPMRSRGCAMEEARRGGGIVDW